MIKFKAKIINNKEKAGEYIIGTSLIKMDWGGYAITNDMEWIDGSEWNCGDFEFIDITTLEIIK